MTPFHNSWLVVCKMVLMPQRSIVAVVVVVAAIIAIVAIAAVAAVVVVVVVVVVAIVANYFWALQRPQNAPARSGYS